ncbi:MAG: family 43 glycosylhydrolase [Streptosporangiales bacterium]|nr:family 43 glycosylhydrolase [Streptosporangiales bacterium]
MATAPTPEGPWRPAKEPLLPPKKTANGYDWVIDPALFTDTDGTLYMYYGSYSSGIHVVRLSADGLRVVSEPTRITASRYEGGYVVHRDGWYYLFGSSANCCAGPTTGYSVYVGRARSPLGPFEHRHGEPMLASRSGGTPVLTRNGNRWIGTGHHSEVVDASGQDWMAYHAIDRRDPWLDVEPGYTMRPMNIDRLDWVDGWPIVRAGRFASAGRERAPVAAGEIDDRFESAAKTRERFTVHSGALEVAGPDRQSGKYAELADGTAATTRPVSDPDVRVVADVRSAADASTGVLARARGAGTGVRARVDADGRELRVEAVVGGQVVEAATAELPDGYDTTAWHSLALQVRGDRADVDVTDTQTGDPWASTELRLPPALTGPGAAGVVSVGAGEVDNLSANPLHEPVPRTVPPPCVGLPAAEHSDDFDGELGSGWSWLRRDEAARVVDGELLWPTEGGDLVGDGQPGALLRETPAGEYTVETKVALDIGTDTNRNYQQAGLLVYDDDDFLRLSTVAVDDTRITEFGKETELDGRRSWGGSVVGAPAGTTWLRLKHTVDAKTGEHRYRAGSSTDGERWTWGATWTMPADSNPKVGLVSQARCRRPRSSTARPPPSSSTSASPGSATGGGASRTSGRRRGRRTQR